MIIIAQLKMFFAVLLYFALISLVGMGFIDSNTSGLTMLIFTVVIIVGFIPLFLWVGGKIFFWKAKKSQAISLYDMQKLLKSFKVDGLKFSYEANNNYYTLCPVEYTLYYANAKKTVKFYIRIWLDDKNKKAKFCDYLIEHNKEAYFNSFKAAKSYQKGMISLSTTMHSSDGDSFRFSTPKLHNKLINLFIDNGWDIQGKFL